MSTAAPSPEAIALYSRDGQTWADGSRVEWLSNEAVRKIVLGVLQSDDENALANLHVPPDLAQRFPNLTHLHLWGVTSLEVLPSLPVNLRCLDVRNCKGLKRLSELPATLDTLDLGGCAALSEFPRVAPRLERLFLDECLSLRSTRSLGNFLASLQDQPDCRLRELDASGCPAVATLEDCPRTIEKLVLRGCEKLESVEGLSEFTRLRHLNLAACARLQSLPQLPQSVQYVELLGSERLTRFMGQDLGPYDRGSDNRRNVAKALRSRMKFGHELTASAHAKLLLLGDGRVGKSTFLKRLQWDCLAQAQQRDTKYSHLKPRKGETFTPRVELTQWCTNLQLAEERAADLNERAASAKLSPPCDAHHQIPGTIRVWDFGGQEIYHQTHRLFAAEGSVFVIVWKADPPDAVALAREKPGRVSDDEWSAWNRQRSLDYWLDYVASIRPDGHVILVCTHCGKGKKRVAWVERAPLHADAHLECFYIDSLDDACPSNPDYKKLVQTIRVHCGAEAARIGIMQPDFYARTSALVDEWLSANQDRASRGLAREHLLISGEDWAETLKTRHEALSSSVVELEDDDVDAITGYLHDAGHIFTLRDRGDDAVLIDQDWATDLIYRLFLPGGFLSERVVKDRGLVEQSTLDSDPVWRHLGEVRKSLLLEYMAQCGIIVRIVNSHEHADGKMIYLATEKWLLPEYGELEEELQRQANVAAGPSSAREDFEFGDAPVTEFDYQALMVHLGRHLGSRATWFRGGMQAADDRAEPTWCFRMRWRAREEHDFLGTIEAQLIAPRGRLREWSAEVQELLTGDGSPLAKHVGLMRQRASDGLERSLFFRDARDSDYDVAISSSGQDTAVVSRLRDALVADGLRVLWYRDPECRVGEHAKVMKFMAELRRPPCILLFLSEAYLRDDPESNWYCVWEFADAINRMAGRQRSPDRTLVAYATGGSLTSSNINGRGIEVLRSMANRFDAWYLEKPEADRPRFDYFPAWASEFRRAAEGMTKFYEERGTFGAYSSISQKSDGSPEFSSVVADIRRALGRRTGEND